MQIGIGAWIVQAIGSDRTQEVGPKFCMVIKAGGMQQFRKTKGGCKSRAELRTSCCTSGQNKNTRVLHHKRTKHKAEPVLECAEQPSAPVVAIKGGGSL